MKYDRKVISITARQYGEKLCCLVFLQKTNKSDKCQLDYPLTRSYVYANITTTGVVR